MNVPAYVWFALLTGLFWGSYGPALGEARPLLANPFQAYVPVGMAYLLWAIVGGVLVLKLHGTPVIARAEGMGWSFAAGSLGALGALALTFAMFSGGAKHPHTVMPIVFGSAVSITALITVLKVAAAGKGELGNPRLWIGIALILIGVIYVTRNTPHPSPAKIVSPPSTEKI